MIPTKDSPELLSRCLNGLYQNTRYPNFEVILADNNTTNKEALEVMRTYPAVRIEIPNPFNFSRANNTAVRHAAGEYLVFLNNDTEIISELWLDHLPSNKTSALWARFSYMKTAGSNTPASCWECVERPTT